MTTQTLETQLAVRLTAEQRQYVQAQRRQLRDHPQLSITKWSEGDVVRELIDMAMRSRVDLPRVHMTRINAQLEVAE